MAISFKTKNFHEQHPSKIQTQLLLISSGDSLLLRGEAENTKEVFLPPLCTSGGIAGAIMLVSMGWEVSCVIGSSGGR